MYTQAIFVEFTVYNANVNLFCIVTLMLEASGIGMWVRVSLPHERCTDIWTIDQTPLSTRGVPVPQWASEHTSLPVDRWPSHLCHDLWSHLLPLHYILHVCPGMNFLDLDFTKVTSDVGLVDDTNCPPPDRGSWSSSINGLISRISGTWWSWRLSFSAGALCLSSSRELCWERGTLSTIKTTKISKLNKAYQ